MYNNLTEWYFVHYSIALEGSFCYLEQIFDITKESFLVKHSRSVLHTFGIDRNIYLSLVERYTANALVFPIQTLTVNETSGNFPTEVPNAVHLDFTIQHIPKFIDAIFHFFPLTRRYQTCFIDPDLKNI
jgi:hypothetical protein